MSKIETFQASIERIPNPSQVDIEDRLNRLVPIELVANTDGTGTPDPFFAFNANHYAVDLGELTSIDWIDTVLHEMLETKAAKYMNDVAPAQADTAIESFDHDYLIYNHSEVAGGQCRVYPAESKRRGGLVALKCLYPTAQHKHLLGLVVEAMSSAQINSPFVMPIYDIVLIDGLASTKKEPTLAIEMPWFGVNSAQTIHQILETKRKNTKYNKKDHLAWVDRVIYQTAMGLEDCHRVGIITKDLKPANILDVEDQERVLLCDFGLTKLSDKYLHTPGMVQGTPLYLPPEMASSADLPITPQMNVHTLGLMAYEMLTLLDLRQSGEIMSMLYDMTAGGDVKLLDQTDTQISEATGQPHRTSNIKRVLRQSLAKNSWERQESVVQFAWEFHQALYA